MLSESNKIRANNSLRLAFVALVVVASSFYFKVPANVLVVKLLIIPMFWLSLLGLKVLYKNPIEEQSVFSANVIEYNALYVVLFGTFMLIICWTPEVELVQIAKGAVGFLVALPLSLFLHHRNQRRMEMSQKNNKYYCSFCGLSQPEVLKLIAGPGVFICENCIDLGVEVMLEESENLKNMPNLNTLVQEAKGNS